MKIHEPRQIRKGAALSEHFHVPQGSLVGANCFSNAHMLLIKARCTTLK
jgi:hypothetical protein